MGGADTRTHTCTDRFHGWSRVLRPADRGPCSERGVGGPGGGGAQAEVLPENASWADPPSPADAAVAGLAAAPSTNARSTTGPMTSVAGAPTPSRRGGSGSVVRVPATVRCFGVVAHWTAAAGSSGDLPAWITARHTRS